MLACYQELEVGKGKETEKGKKEEERRTTGDKGREEYMRQQLSDNKSYETRDSSHQKSESRILCFFFFSFDRCFIGRPYHLGAFFLDARVFFIEGGDVAD